MDSNDELMIQAIMENEANATVDEDEHLEIISYLLVLQVELNAANKHGGSKFGRKKIKKRHRMEDHCMLYANYFSDESIYTPKRIFGGNL
jgi:hypothetical protein